MAQIWILGVSGMSVRRSDSGARRTLRATEKKYLECLDLGHAWDFPAFLLRREPAHAGHPAKVTRTLFCVRCGTMRDDTMTGQDLVCASTYRYPSDYPRSGNGQSITSRLVREEILRRIASGSWKDPSESSANGYVVTRSFPLAQLRRNNQVTEECPCPDS
jgi:hypothetical protein